MQKVQEFWTMWTCEIWERVSGTENKWKMNAMTTWCIWTIKLPRDQVSDVLSHGAKLLQSSLVGIECSKTKKRRGGTFYCLWTLWRMWILWRLWCEWYWYAYWKPYAGIPIVHQKKSEQSSWKDQEGDNQLCFDLCKYIWLS